MKITWQYYYNKETGMLTSSCLSSITPPLRICIPIYFWWWFWRACAGVNAFSLGDTGKSCNWDVFEILSVYLHQASLPQCDQENQYHERIHNQIYEKIKDQFEDPDYYFVNELTENIQKAIENLPETYRETFAMSRFGEKTNVQIAEKLGISVKTVEYRISQALKILRFKLKDYLPLLINILG